MLHFEITHDLSYRNYGRSLGGKILTDIIEYCERVDARSKRHVRSALTNGATDGAHCLMSYLLDAEHITHQAVVAMVGMAFPVYSSLMNRLGLEYVEIYDDQTIVPEIEVLFDAFERVRPAIIILALPHNPSGVMQNIEYYRAIMDWAAANGSFVFVDRVCLMPWDNMTQLNQVFHPHVADDRCFIIDSPSKSNSLAGIRLGLVLMGETHIEGFEKEIRCRSLNPAVFGSTTFALCRLGNLCFHLGPKPARRIARFMRRYLHMVYRQYPSDFVPPDVDCEALIQTFVADYCKEVAILRKRITVNQASIVDVLGEISDRSIILDGGFNVLVSSDKMKAANEVSDQQELASRHGVCVLTQRCFQSDPQDNGTYFLRLSLSVPEDGFRKALEVMKDYFDAA
ncbi:MAG: pyridoxal phosphate-dependent aminotransferase [Paracoccaceae bacterium]